MITAWTLAQAARVQPVSIQQMKRFGLIGLIAALAAVGCGDGSETGSGGEEAASVQRIASCLEQDGATIGRVLEEESGTFNMLFAVTPEATFNIANLADAGLSKQIIKFMERSKARAGIEGKMITTVVNEGLTVVGVVAAPTSGDPLPSRASERLAKDCATSPNGASA
jgi:hypothetical protein